MNNSYRRTGRRSRSRTRSRSRSRSRDNVKSSSRRGGGEYRRRRSSSRGRGNRGSNTTADIHQNHFPREDVELFIGNLTSSDATEDMLKDFLNLAMRESKLIAHNAPDPIIACRLSYRYGFIEFAGPEECTKGLNLNGIPFLGSMLRINRPARYSGSITEGISWQELTGDTFVPEEVPSYPPEGTLRLDNFSVVDQQQYFTRDQTPSQRVPKSSSHQQRHQNASFPHSSSNGHDAYYYATKSVRELFIGNITEQMTNEGVKDFLGGALQKMGMCNYGVNNPIQDIKITGKFAFIVCYKAEDAANMLNLNGIPFLGQFLKIERPSKFDGALPGIIHYSWNDLYSLWCSGDLKLMTAGSPTRVLRITNMASAQELLDDNYYLDLIQETRLECAQFGIVKSVIIPRLSSSGSANLINENDIGKVYVEMTTLIEAKNVLLSLKGRTFNGRCVDVKYYPEDKFRSFNYSFESPDFIITASHGAVLKEQVLTPASLSKLAPML
mmetsp:Transcript_25284/g.27602  ORF Transcript_25284/g.27602 Transcript_25284/m.27602 type:complete len:497 (+) Transcript_25284:36-1526(+)|eukprot:gene28-30_t